MSVPQITEPGVYPLLPSADYHAQTDSLSASGTKLLLPPSCPALYEWAMTNGRADKTHYDVGHALHKEVLGEGEEVVVVDSDSWRTKAAKETAAAARTEGKVPLLAKDYATVQAMAKAVREHPFAGALFAPGSGEPEVSMFWRDEETGVLCRSRHDWLRHPNPNGRRICVDLKSAHSIDRASLEKTAANNGWYTAAAHYLDGIKALGLGDDSTVFLFVAVLKTEPHLIQVLDLDWTALELGRRQNRKAREIFRACKETGHWPSYSDEPITLSLPRWVERDLEGAFS